MRSNNPVLTRRDAFSRGAYAPSAQYLEEMYRRPSAPPVSRPMTLDDVVVRTAATLGTVVAVAGVSWYLNLGLAALLVGALGGLVLALVISFKRITNPALILAYAALEGLALGVISHIFNSAYNGIVTQAVIGTVLAFAGMLAAYALRIVRVTQRFAKIVIGAGIALLLLMLVNMVVAFFVPGGIGIRGDGAAGWIFSVIAIAVACLFLALDFAEIENAIKYGAPEREAWIAAFGLTVTLVWLYLELLRFLARFRQ